MVFDEMNDKPSKQARKCVCETSFFFFFFLVMMVLAGEQSYSWIIGPTAKVTTFTTLVPVSHRLPFIVRILNLAFVDRDLIFWFLSYPR